MAVDIVTVLLLGIPILSKDGKPTLKSEERVPDFKLLWTIYGELTRKTIEEQLACFLSLFISLQICQVQLNHN